jgi:hypothetical protein
MKWRTFACSLLLMLFCARGYADERAVIVLIANDLGSDEWPEGTQAVIAELSANAFQVVRQWSHAASAGELLAEVAHSASPQAVLGVVAVLREGNTGAAYVWTEHGERVLRDDSSGTHGAVAEGAVALRVVELLRTETLKFPIDVSALQRPRKPEQARTIHASHGPWLNAWLGVSTVIPTSATTMPLQMSLGTAVELGSAVVLDLGARVGILPGRFETSAGHFSLRSEEFGGRMMLDPRPARHVSFALGLGVSSLWLQETATGDAGFLGKSDNTQVMLLALRARLTLRSGRFFGVFVVDPGLTLPPVSVHSNLGEVAHVGRPWLTTELGVGWSF